LRNCKGGTCSPVPNRQSNKPRKSHFSGQACMSPSCSPGMIR
jgi:hypothetical protein